MLTVMNRNTNFSYDSNHDILRITLTRTKNSFYYDEIKNGVFLKYDDDTDNIIGLMIMNPKSKNIRILKQYLLTDVVAEVEHIINNL